MKAVIKSLDEVAEPLRAEYKQEGSVFVLKLEGDTKHPDVVGVEAKLAEFRDNNRTLNTQLTELQTKFKDIDPAKYADLQAKVVDLEGKAKKMPEKDGEITALKTQLDTIAAQLAESSKLTAETRARERRASLENALTKAGMKAGVQEAALPDYIARGMQTFDVKEDGAFVAKNGTSPLYSKVNVTEPMGVDEWAVELTKTAPHLFKASVGGGSTTVPGNSGVLKTLEATDALVLGQNLEGIAKGTVAVTMPGMQ